VGSDRTLGKIMAQAGVGGSLKSGVMLPDLLNSELIELAVNHDR